MAKKPADKATGNTKGGNGSGIMTILQIAGFGLGTIALMVLVAAMQDLGFVDLTHTLEIAIVPMLVLIVLSVSLYAFANSKIHAAKFAAAQQAVDEAKEAFEQRIAAVEARIEGHIGGEYERLKAENEQLKGHFDEIRKQEDEKIGIELEQLRQKNAELQDKISTWAVNSVDAAMSDESKSAA